MKATAELANPARRADVIAAVRGLDEAETPLPRAAFRALGDETLRAAVEQTLAGSGRVLVETPTGFISGYDDTVREALVTDGICVLPEVDRAVLTLVLLWSVAIPRARGTIPADADWTVAEAIDPRTLTTSKLPDSSIRGAIRRLREAGILGFGTNRWVVPGPQFHRLTPQVQEDLFHDLVLLAEPNGLLAESIRRRRAGRSATEGATA